MPIGDVPVNAVVLVRPGGRIPLDGVVKQGESAIDQAMITGESEPVEVRMRAGASSPARSTRPARCALPSPRPARGRCSGQIVAMVEQAQTSKAGVQRLADKVAGVFVPAVIVIALGTLLGWGTCLQVIGVVD